MSFTPIIPFSGYAGWSFLSRTEEKQQAAFVSSASFQKDEVYFRENIPTIKTAEALVNDYRLLRVALGAFGLGDDINNKFFIRNILEQGSLDRDALANKLTDKRYLEFTKAFGFGDFRTPRTVLSDFADNILEQYRVREFEIAVGEVDGTLRLAMNLKRELPKLAEQENSEVTKWYMIIGSEPLSAAVQIALGLPESIGGLHVDQQLRFYQDKAEKMFGTSDPAIFSDGPDLDELVKTFLLRSQLSSTPKSNSGSIALQLLTSSNTSSLLLRL